MGTTKKVVACSLFLCSLTATVIFVVAFATPHWESGYNEHNGLWEKCHGRICTQFRQKEMQGWLSGVQTLECLGLVGMVILLMLCSTLACGLPVPKDALTKIVFFLSAFTAGCITLGVVIYVIKCQMDMDYSFFLAAASPLLVAVMALLTFALRRLSEWRP